MCSPSTVPGQAEGPLAVTRELGKIAVTGGIVVIKNFTKLAALQTLQLGHRVPLRPNSGRKLG